MKHLITFENFTATISKGAQIQHEKERQDNEEF